MNYFWLFKNLTGIAIAAIALLVSNGLAVAEYKPPDKPSAPKSPTTTTGTRGGCEASGKTALTALAPQSYIGQTVSLRPTFAWFVPDSRSFPLEFRLYEYGRRTKPREIEKVKLQSKSGVMKLTLTETQLSVGQKYRWQIVVFCDPNRPSSALVTEAEIEVVAKSATLQQALAATNDPVETANLYAERGLWYDALGEVIATRAEAGEEFKLALLEELARLEATKEATNSDRLESLRQTISLEL